MAIITYRYYLIDRYSSRLYSVYEDGPLHCRRPEDLKRHGNMAGRVRNAMAAYAADPAAHANNVTRLVNTTAYRMRVSDFRVIFEDAGDTLTVTRIGPRGGVYD